MADAVVRGGWRGDAAQMTDQIFLRAMEFEGHHGVSDEERADAQVIEVDIELDARPAPGGHVRRP